jgi:indolepyruvate ferredoxin oxidoreductase
MPNTANIVTLDDKWVVNTGCIFLNGPQALVRVLLTQHRLDLERGLRTAGYVSGYRGSPLGNFDSALWAAAKWLKESNIVFQPGVNEDLAATAIHGTQQLDAVPNPAYDGVFAAWYGKGPGVDRSLDALKHGNYAGVHPHGGVLVIYGDDHAGKSSTVAHQSEQALASCLIPSLYPANVSEILEFGRLGYALSRYSGAWIGLKCVNEVAEQTATVLVGNAEQPITPAYPIDLPAGIHCRVAPFNPLGDEEIALEHRLPLVRAFVKANNIDRTVFRASKPRLGVVTAGKSFGDVQAAIALLGLNAESAATHGLSLYKVGCIWPLEGQGLAAFATGHEALLFVEEKKPFLEQQAALLLANQAQRPALFGKTLPDGHRLLPMTRQLEAEVIADAILAALTNLGVSERDLPVRPLRQMPAVVVAGPAAPRRVPYFCSGCPHNRSTRIPEGSQSLTGIGCHAMVNFVRPEALPSMQMGGEGANWIGLAPFTKTEHIFQNMGDGTYYHSGLLAIRAAVASGVNITYKILYNDAVAMTGGQPVDGPISVAQIAQQVRHEGVATIIIVSDDPSRHTNAPALPTGVKLAHRDELDSVQRELRAISGCTVLIYEQTCAAEKRRRRKRGAYPDPAKRLFIAEAVCEGCGDCSTQSTCVSLVPVETELGRKRAIDQASCNKDYSCVNGFCPSFITVYGAELRKPATVRIDADLFKDLPEPTAPPLEHPYNVMVAGVGGTGVVTVAALLGMAAHIDGAASSLFDMTGLAQKNGAVYSHVRIARSPLALHEQRIGAGQADLILAYDLVAAVGDDSFKTLMPDRTQTLANTAVSPTVAFQLARDTTIDTRLLLEKLRERTKPGALHAIDASGIAMALTGDVLAGNLLMIGVALQSGLLPIGLAALQQAIRLNGTAVNVNLTALQLGRLYAADPPAFQALLSTRAPRKRQLPDTLEEIVVHRKAQLTAYQDSAYAERYEALVQRVVAADQDEHREISKIVARNYAKLLAYKDEYEVARLLTSPELRCELEAQFELGGRLAFNLAPPIFGGKLVNGRPKKREMSFRMRPMLRMLSALRVLRGTALDVFCRTVERRMERALIAEYEELVTFVLPRLTPDSYRAATALLNLIDRVRGFGPVKMEAAAVYRQQVLEARAAFLAVTSSGDAFSPSLSRSPNIGGAQST